MTDFNSYISIDPEIRFGKPCIKGTRIAVTDILQWLASGTTNSEILEGYPSLKKEDILAALEFSKAKGIHNDPGKSAWLKAVSSNLAFDFLKDSAEEIYSLNDGKPLNDNQ